MMMLGFLLARMGVDVTYFAMKNSFAILSVILAFAVSSFAAPAPSAVKHHARCLRIQPPLLSSRYDFSRFEAYPTKNFGSSIALLVCSGSNTYIKFNFHLWSI